MATAVSTFAELKNALENTDETEIYFDADITMNVSGGIKIPNTKQNVVISGTNNGIRRTFTDYGPATGFGAAADVIQFAAPNTTNAYSITLQDMDITGYNYYGILYNTTNANVTHILRNVSYTGPQPGYNTFGPVEYYDCTMSINTTAHAAAQEIAECNSVVLGGNVTIDHRTAYVCFNMGTGSTASRSITIAEKADVTINAQSQLVNTANAKITVKENAVFNFNATGNPLFSNTTLLPLTLENGAVFNCNADSGFSTAAAFRLGPVTIGDNASLTCVQTARNDSLSTMYCEGAFTVGEGASVWLEGNYTGTANRVLEFYGTSSSLVLNNPRRFVVKSTAANAMRFNSNTALQINAVKEANLWNTAPDANDPGGFSDPATNTWERVDGLKDADTLQIAGTMSNTAFTVTNTNLTPEEQAQLPALTSLIPAAAYVFSVGTLPLDVNPIANDGWPVFGTTEVSAALQVSYTQAQPVLLTGNAGTDGSFSIATADTIPLGTPVTVKANHLFLNASKQLTVIEPGELTMGDPDEFLTFIAGIITQTPAPLCGREDPDWSITVTDSRARSTPWTIEASIDKDLTGNQGHTLPGSLVYVNESRISPLSAAPTTIWQNPPNGGQPVTTTVKWPSTEGLLLQLTTTPIFNKESYTCKVSFELNPGSNGA